MPHELIENQKKPVILKCHLFIKLCKATNHFLIRLWHATKSGFYMTTSSVVGLRSSSKAFPKAKLAPKKGHGHCLVVYCQSDPLQLFESLGNHYTWEVCSGNWWDAPDTAMPAAGIGQQKGPSSPQECPTAHQTTSASKVEWIGLWSFTSSVIFTWPLANQLHFFKHLNKFLQGKCFHNEQEAENAFQEFMGSWSMDFYATGINISCWQKYVDCNVSCFG